MTKRICIWSGPRNISTALMYSFAQRKDTTVVDEPLYAHYLTSTEANEYHPGAEEVIASQDNDGQKVIQDVVLGDYDTPVAFIKHMTHHLVDLDWSFMQDTINIILTRDPYEMLTSFVKQIPNPVATDTGYPQHLELMEYLRSIGQEPLVVDSKSVLKNPRKKLAEICNYCRIPFDEAMLKWEAGARPEDGVWAKYWYHNVHKSTGFMPHAPKNAELPEKLNGVLKECEELYNKILSV